MYGFKNTRVRTQWTFYQLGTTQTVFFWSGLPINPYRSRWLPVRANKNARIFDRSSINRVIVIIRDYSLSLGINTSPFILTMAGFFSFAPSPSVMYPPRPVNAPIPIPIPSPVTVTLLAFGSAVSVNIMVSRDRRTCSVCVYARHATPELRNAIARGLCGNARS